MSFSSQQRPSQPSNQKQQQQQQQRKGNQRQKQQQQKCVIIVLVGSCLVFITFLRLKFITQFHDVPLESLPSPSSSSSTSSLMISNSTNVFSLIPPLLRSTEISSTNSSKQQQQLLPHLWSDHFADSSTNNVNTTAASSSSLSAAEDSCFRLNSKTWLKGPRLGNAPVPDDWLEGMMMMMMAPPFSSSSRMLNEDSLAHLKLLLTQTLCHASGPFCNITYTSSSEWSNNNTFQQNLQNWQFRLMYLAIHYDMHRHARDEYQWRRQCQKTLQSASSSLHVYSFHTTNRTLNSHHRHRHHHGVSNFDYECPNAKFVIVVLKTMGMGATFRNGIMPSIYTALVTGRIPIFVSPRQLDDFYYNSSSNNNDGNGNGNNNQTTRSLPSFPLASCPRNDLQCVFLPLSPCTLTLNDIRTATNLTGAEHKQLKRFGTYRNESHEHARVLLYRANLIPLRPAYPINDKIRAWAHRTIQALLQEWNSTFVSTSTPPPPPQQQEAQQQHFWNIWTTALEFYHESSFSDDANHGYGKTYRNMGAALFYILRPNAKARIEMARQLQATMKMNVSSDSNASNTIAATTTSTTTRQFLGLPIRASDKCELESTCLSFDRYMELMVEKWQQHGVPGHRGTILLTSEDSSILPLRFAYTQNSSFPLDIWVNENDVQPNSGEPHNFPQDHADAIMISSLTALQLQLQASVIVANCCSNFHSLLRSLVGEGCGRYAPHDVQFECLDESTNPKYRICCAWNRRDSLCP